MSRAAKFALAPKFVLAQGRKVARAAKFVLAPKFVLARGCKVAHAAKLVSAQGRKVAHTATWELPEDVCLEPARSRPDALRADSEFSFSLRLQSTEESREQESPSPTKAGDGAQNSEPPDGRVSGCESQLECTERSTMAHRLGNGLQ